MRTRKAAALLRNHAWLLLHNTNPLSFIIELRDLLCLVYKLLKISPSIEASIEASQCIVLSLIRHNVFISSP
jgi:hypothetical protein